MRYLSVCSGIEAASVAWEPLGWTPVAFSEIDPFASAVLAARFPHVPNLGDLEKHETWNIEPGSVDVLVGGTPCQSFSVAGLRKGLEDPRGNLALVYLGLVDRLRPRWTVWENVPGVLSVDGGRAFGSFLGGLAQLGYGFAYRVMDAQYVRVESHPRAVPQRRRRVFVVGCAGGDWRSAAEVLLEPEGVRGNSPPRREAGKAAPGGTRPGAPGGGVEAVGFEPRYYLRDNKTGGAPADTSALTATAWKAGDASPHVAVAGDECQNLVPAWPAKVAPTFGTAWDGRMPGGNDQDWISQHGGLFVPEPLPFDTTQVTSVINRSNPQPGDPCHSLMRGGAAPSVAFPVAAPTLTSANDPSRLPQSSEVTQQVAAVHTATMAVRRLTPRECERLQGFPDDWTAITYRGKPAADGPRYKALGNSMAVNVMRWLGERISHRRE